MKNDLSKQCFDWFPCSFFHVGTVEIGLAAGKLLSDDQITGALKRHTNCDFGEVSWDHFNGNLQLIADGRGVITSIYISLEGKQFRITTRLDEFNPHTHIFTV